MSLRYPTRDAYRQAWKDSEKNTPPVPLNVDLELASVCNLSCPFCFISDGSFDKMIKMKSDDGKPRRRLMPTEMAIRVIDECAALGVPAMKFNWRGESTLHPDYSKILKHAAGKRHTSAIEDGFYSPVELRNPVPAFHDLLVNTNANCQDHAIPGLMAATKVMVSLDSLVPETYAEMRRGGDLGSAKRVVHKLVALEHPNLWVRRVITKRNENEGFYWDVKRTFRPFGSVHVSEHFCIDRNEVANYESGDCTHDLLPRRFCGYPNQRIVVAATGKCYPCCIDLHETMPMGDVRFQTLEEIWSGVRMRRLRKVLTRGNVREWSAACRNCESWMSYDVPQRGFVSDVELSDERPTIIGLVTA